MCGSSTLACRVLSLAGNLRQWPSATPRQRTTPTASVSPATVGRVPEGATFTWAARYRSSPRANTSLELHPFATTRAFGCETPVRTKPHVVAVLSSTRLPGFIGHDLFTTTGSSATSHRFDFLLSCLLKSSTARQTSTDDARLPQLLCRLPVGNRILNHILPLSTIWASRLFARLPRQAAESGSLTLWTTNLLSLPSDPTVGQ